MTADHAGCRLVEAMLRDDLDAARAALVALKSATLVLAVEALGFAPDPERRGVFVSRGIGGLLDGLTIERVNQLLEPHGFPGLHRAES
jgi:hypothetical protein